MDVLSFDISDGEYTIKMQCQVASRIPTAFGNVYLHYYDEKSFAITKHAISKSLLLLYKSTNDPTIIPPIYNGTKCMDGVPIVRIHSSCYTGEVLGSLRCDCGEQLLQAMEVCDIVIYLQQEGRGIGLYDKLRAYNLQDEGHDTVSANEALQLPIDNRHYEQAAWIIKDFGVQSIRLMTNNPEKMKQLEDAGITVRERIPTRQCKSHPEVSKYLNTKKNRMGHML